MEVLAGLFLALLAQPILSCCLNRAPDPVGKRSRLCHHLMSALGAWGAGSPQDTL